ncbi:MAG: hypothetical protein ACW964_20440, partial [Candidatus Hodarchaeales archaeon]
YVPRQGKTNPYAWENWDSFIDDYLAARIEIVSPLLADLPKEDVKDLHMKKKRRINFKRIFISLSFLIFGPFAGGMAFFLIGFPSSFGLLAGVAGSFITLFLYLEKKPEKIFI